METRTIHEKDERGDQRTVREVDHDGETYRFEVDLDAADDDEADGHEYDGDRAAVPAEVEQALGEFGAGASPAPDPAASEGGDDA